MKPKREHRVTEARQLEALASPARMEIITAVDSLGRCTAADLAASLGRSQSSLYFHLEKLIAIGLLQKEEGAAGAIYSSIAEGIGLTYAPQEPDTRSLLAKNVGVIMRSAERTIRKALDSGRAKVRGRGVDTVLSSGRAFLTPAELREVRNHMTHIDDILRRARASREGKLIAFTACLAPVVAKTQKRG